MPANQASMQQVLTERYSCVVCFEETIAWWKGSCDVDAAGTTFVGYEMQVQDVRTTHAVPLDEHSPDDAEQHPTSSSSRQSLLLLLCDNFTYSSTPSNRLLQQ